MFAHTLKRRSGFTLIELLVVMAIIGLLVGISASTFQTSRVKAKDGRRKGNIKQIQNALEQYMADHDTYPAASSGEIVACGATGTSTCDWGSSFIDENGTTYMAELPSDVNAPTIEYVYFVSTDRKQYQLFIHLENSLDPDIKNYSGKTCTTSSTPCNYGQSSSNTTPGATLN